MAKYLLKEEKEQIEVWSQAIVKACYEGLKNSLFDGTIYYDLTGGCAIASYHLKEKMKSHGMLCDWVIGYHSDMDFGSHCWIEYKKKIIDPTARQFNYNNTKIFQRNKEKYNWVLNNPKAKEFINYAEWGLQSPYLYYCYWVDDYCWFEEKERANERANAANHSAVG